MRKSEYLIGFVFVTNDEKDILMEIFFVSVNNETISQFETLYIVCMFVLFPLPIVKTFLKIAHLLYSETYFFLLLTL